MHMLSVAVIREDQPSHNKYKEKMPSLCTDREEEKKVIAKQDRGTFLSQKGRFAMAHNSRWLI